MVIDSGVSAVKIRPKPVMEKQNHSFQVHRDDQTPSSQPSQSVSTASGFGSARSGALSAPPFSNSSPPSHPFPPVTPAASLSLLLLPSDPQFHPPHSAFSFPRAPSSPRRILSPLSQGNISQNMPIPKGLQSAGKGAETSHFPGDAAPAGKTKGSRSKKAKRAFPIEELPREIQEKILQEYVAMLAPKLMMVKSSGKIPLTKKPEKQHINSKLLSEKIPAEQDVLFPLLRVSKMWYSMVSQYILRHTVYISSARALDRLTIFEMRRNMAVLDIYPLDPGPTIDNSEIDTPGRTVFGIWAQYKKDSRNIWIPTSETDTYVFDVNCQGPGWSKTKAPDDTTALPWMGIPAWIIGKSRNIGDHMYEDDKDGEVEGGKEDESSLAEGFGGTRSTCISLPIFLWFHWLTRWLNVLAPKTKRFLENMKSLILAPDWTSYADADPWCAWNVCHLERPDMNHHFPGAYLMYRILSGSGGAPELRKLVISGNILGMILQFATSSAEIFLTR